MKKAPSKARKPLKQSVTKKTLAVKSVKRSRKSIWPTILVMANILAFVAVLLINYLAVTLPIGGYTTGALSDMYPNLFTPAALTFSIWGVIYLGLLGFVVWQAVDFYKQKSRGITKKIGIWFLLSCAANIGRMFARQYQQVFLSVLIMLAFLVILIFIVNRAQVGKKIGGLWDKYLVHVPLSLYLGRISVATIANISALLVHVGWGMRGMSDIFRTNALIIIAALLALLALYKKYNIIFALVVVRAFIGIIIKRVSVDPVYASSIIWILGICIAFITAGIGRRFEQWKKN